MTEMEKRAAAKAFAADWNGRGDEKQETQAFWMALLQKVFGVAEPEKHIEFEVRVKLGHTSFIDGLIRSTRVLIEQKGQDVDLRKGYRQSDGSMLTPYQQARRYAGYLPHDLNPRWIVVCNFQEFHIHDMNRPNDAPEVVLLSDLEKEYKRLNFLVDTGDENIKREMEISMQAGELVGKLYDAFLKQYKDPSNESTLKSLNALCVRLVFCLYAEDAGIFGKPKMFHDYMRKCGMQKGRKALRELFRILDQRIEERDPYLADDDPELAAFPYVNGGLFSDEDIEIPPFNEEIFDLLLTRASEDFDWSEISPTIFGAVFESTLNPETRRKGGMHYTSIENIHKVIDPLFLDDLRAELDEIKRVSAIKTREKRLNAFQDKLASLKFLDPACGSGNFLTETYLSLRKLENEVLKELYGGQIVLGAAIDPIKISIRQFYGIEINDFAATVAKTALWIAESQMMKQTEDVVHMNLDFLPLKSYVNIVEGNALRIDWETVVPKAELNYIMGNPPFVGAAMMDKTQKDDAVKVFGKIKLSNSIDYVGAWYHKAASMMQDTLIRAAFVSTNSITQGEQVAPLWDKILNYYKMKIDFGYRTFNWNSEASEKAKVHCVIIGFSGKTVETTKRIYCDNHVVDAININPYLCDAPDVLVLSISLPICNVPIACKGSMPIDNGNFIFTNDEKEKLIADAPNLAQCMHRYIGARDFINGGEPRFCIWLDGVSPSEYRNNREVMRRIQNVQAFRQKSTAKPTQKAAERPSVFYYISYHHQPALVIPEASSYRRKYIPIGFIDAEIIPSNLLVTISGASIYDFGIVTSNVHMAWMRTVAGRLKSDYRYSGNTVYNTFPWPNPTDAQKAKIEQTAQAILDARALYPDCSLADLYDEVTMPPELRKAHQQNDRAVMEAYGMSVRDTTEASCVAELMRRYQELTK